MVQATALSCLRHLKGNKNKSNKSIICKITLMIVVGNADIAIFEYCTYATNNFTNL